MISKQSVVDLLGRLYLLEESLAAEIDDTVSLLAPDDQEWARELLAPSRRALDAARQVAESRFRDLLGDPAPLIRKTSDPEPIKIDMGEPTWPDPILAKPSEPSEPSWSLTVAGETIEVGGPTDPPS